MVELNIYTSIDAKTVMETDNVELFINNEIKEALIQKIMVALDDMAYVDMNYIDSEEMFNVKAELVLCTMKDVETNAQLQAQLMASYGLEEDQILEVLKLGIDDKSGF